MINRDHGRPGEHGKRDLHSNRSSIIGPGACSQSLNED
jgi:hypothetical protein